MTKTISASTLARQAAKTKNPKEAKRLRAQAAKLRREQRLMGTSAKSLAKAVHAGDRAKAIDRAENRIGAELNEALYGDNAITRQSGLDAATRHLGDVNLARGASVDHTSLVNAPGRGEIVGGYLAHMAEELAKLARKKGGVDAIQGRLMTLEHQNRHDEKVYANQRVEKAVKDANEQWRTNIVAGFIARCDALESASRNGLPDAMIVDGVTMARVIDALKAAGYTARGKEQKATEQRVWRAVER